MSKPILYKHLKATLLRAYDLNLTETVNSLVTPGPQIAEVSLWVLLVEDNMINQQLAVRLLEKSGHQVVVCENGAEALAAIENRHFDLVLMDMQMPVMDGIDATRAIRSREAVIGGHLPIVAMTANVMAGDRERCLSAGMDDYISKPIQAAKLIDCIASVCSARGDIALNPRQDKEVPAISTAFDYKKAVANTDPEVLAFIGTLALQNIPGYAADIRSALVLGNCDGVQQAAHTLKGVVGYFCARPIVEAAENIEACSIQGNLSDAEHYFEHLQGEVLKFMPHLDAILQSGGNPRG